MSSESFHSNPDIRDPIALLPRADFDLPAMPAPVTSILGREIELAQISELLETGTARIVTLTGPGGIGKTRLALEVARRSSFPAFVSLAAVSDSDLLIGTIESQLGIESQIGRSPAENVISALRQRDVLLVLDNLEHLLAGVSDLSELLSACQNLTILATSRIRLGLSGEHVVPIDPLKIPETGKSIGFDEIAGTSSVQLFVERARAIHPSFVLSKSNVDAVRTICRHLDGLPLAVELAAARSNMLSPESLAARLEHRLELLTGGPRDVPRRLQTMRAAIEWSYELLPDVERVFWERLGVFSGGFTADAAIAVGQSEDTPDLDPLASLESLIAQGLVRSTATTAGEPRFSMLETTREYASQQLATRVHEIATRNAHADFFRAYAAEAEPFLRSTDPEPWFTRLDAELPNLRQALSWNQSQGQIEHAVLTAASLAWFWTWPNYLTEGLGWYESLFALEARDLTDETHAKALHAAGDLADWLGQTAKATSFHSEALVVWRRLGNDEKIGSTLRSLGSNAIDRLDFDLAEQLLREARELSRSSGSLWDYAGSCNLLSSATCQLGKYQEAVAFGEEALQSWQKSGHTQHFPMALNQLGWTYVDSEDFPRAYECFESALSSAPSDEINEIAMSILGHGRIARKQGQLEVATQLVAAAQHQRKHFGTELRPIVTLLFESLFSSLQSSLGVPRFASAMKKGQELDLSAAIAMAQSVTVPLPTNLHESDLSSRELEVLALLVEGTSDVDIADRLFITRRTASKHVASILDKLQAPNRTAAATIAHRRGLV